MNFKIVFSDIDGTLLNKDRKLSSLTKRVFRELQQKIPIVLISSRMPAAMRHLQEELHIEHQPLIAYNGGLVLVKNKPIHSTEIPLEILKDLHTFNLSEEAHLSLYNNDDWYVPRYDQWAEREEQNTQVKPQVKQNSAVIEEWEKEGKGPHKIMCMGVEEKISAIENYLFERYAHQLHLYRSKPTYLEIANNKISKLTGINLLLKEHFNLSLSETIAFGDNHNDYEMIKAAGMGIAVGNAKQEIIHIARYTAHNSHDDGVAVSLQQLFKMG